MSDGPPRSRQKSLSVRAKNPSWLQNPEQISTQVHKRYISSITSNYQQIWRPDEPMSLMYQALLEVSMNKITLWIDVCADDWIAERAIIASNVLQSY